MSDKIMIAMSGGVDSSVTAYLAKKNFSECAGGTMLLQPEFDASDAKKVADKLDIPFFELEFQRDFINCVVHPFVETYKNGGTPNPCVECNQTMKFGLLRKRAERFGYNKIATGHYAQIQFDESLDRYVLKKALDSTRDQSYFLYALTQEQLKNTYLPLGEMTKDEVRKIANEQNFENANRKDSQDICFIPDGDYSKYIEEYSNEKFPEGDFVDLDGNVLGTHKGIIRYTVGQRKGLGLALPEPMYVFEKDVLNNKVILCRDDQLFHDTVVAKKINLITMETIGKPLQIKAKIRSSQTEQPATVIQTTSDEMRIMFDEPQRAIAKGQSVVLYDGDMVVGGGIIS